MLVRIPHRSALWTSMLAASAQLPQGTALLLKDRASPEDVDREEGSGFAVRTQVEVLGPTVTDCDFEPAPLGLSLPTWTASRMNSQT